MSYWIRIILVFLMAVLASCADRETGQAGSTVSRSFEPGALLVPDKGVRKVRGQVLYMPVYSNIPFQKEKDYDLSAFLAIHNTDLKHRIKITKVTLFNTNGKVVKQFLSGDHLLEPLATAIYSISQKEQSGAGANFIVEWTAENLVTEPLVESIMKDLSGNLGISFLSVGKVIREIQ